MKLETALILPLLLAGLAMAEPETLHLGPFTVSFDSGQAKHEWNITESRSETFGGIPFTRYKASSDPLSIAVSDYQINFLLDSDPVYRKPGLEQAYNNGPCVRTSEAIMRIIDGHEGLVMGIICSGTSVIYSEWFMNNSRVSINSLYPWNGGTLQMLKTIHIEEARRPAS